MAHRSAPHLRPIPSATSAEHLADAVARAATLVEVLRAVVRHDLVLDRHLQHSVGRLVSRIATDLDMARRAA